MDDKKTNLLTWVGVVFVGVPAALFLWESQIDRFSRSAISSHTRRGDTAIAEGRYLEAIAAYGHARELAPTDPTLQRGVMRSRAYLVAEQPLRITNETAEELRYEANYLLDADRGNAA